MDMSNVSSNDYHPFQPPPVSTSYAVVATLIWLINTIMVIGLNAVCLVVFHKTTRIEEVTKVFLMSLSSSDLMLGIIFGIPSVVTSAINKWPFGSPTCNMQAFLGCFLTISGQMSLFVVNVERFIAIAFPLRHVSLITLWRAQLATVIIWLAALILAIANGFGANWTILFASLVNHCVYYNESQYFADNFLFYAPYLIGIFLPYLVTIILYLKIVSIARQHAIQIAATMPNNPEGHQGGKIDTKAATTFFLVISAYSFAVLPLMVVLIKNLDMSVYAWLGLRQVWFSVSWVDAVIYMWRNKQFREEFKRIVLSRNE